MPVDTKLSRMVTWLTMYERLPLIKPHHSLITWPTWGHMAFSKVYISTLAILMAIQLGRVLTSRRSFSTQTLKLSRTSSFLVFCLRSLKFPTIFEGVFSSYNFFFFTPRRSVRSVEYLMKVFAIVLVSYKIFSFSAKIIVSNFTYYWKVWCNSFTKIFVIHYIFNVNTVKVLCFTIT